MIKLIKNGEVFSPKYIGKKDILICDGRIAAISENISIDSNIPVVATIDAKNKYIFPGFIDCHVHILGGGGEGGYSTRTPEIRLTTLTSSGVTTVVGCLGTDGVCRSLKSLIAKAKGLKEEGVSTYLYTGSYDIPVRTLTGSIKEDIMLIEEFIGIGEVAVSDHRSSSPTYEELKRCVAEARVGGMLSGKAGIVNIHMGDGKSGLSMINDIVDNTDIPINQFLPTHMARSERLLSEGIEFIKKGGYIDFTTSTTQQFIDDGEVECSKALKRVIDETGSSDNVSFSSDGQGSMPMFDESGAYIGLTVGDSRSLFEYVRKAILEENVSVEDAIKVITSNPARFLKLRNKGIIQVGSDADLVLTTKESLEIRTVIARGDIMILDGKILKKDVFNV